MTDAWHWQPSPFAAPPAARIGRTLADALLDLAETRPHATAVIDGGRRTSVAGLAGRVGGLARTIATAGAGPGPVALIQSAGVDAVAAWFACAVAGRPFLLLEPHNPPGRNAELIALAGATLILHDAAVRHAVPEGLDGVIAIRPDGAAAPFARGAGLDPAAPAMIFPTSGSTGEPKLITYAAHTMQAKMQASVGLMGAAPGEVVLIAGSHGNFGFVHHALVFLLAGGVLCLLDLREAGLAALFATIRDEGVGHVRFTPSLFRAAAEQPEAAAALRGLKGVRFSGEPLLWNDVETARRILDPGCRIQNVYGSTESAIFIWTDDRLAARDRAVAPIGRIYPLWEFAIRPEAGDAREGRLFIRSRHQALGDWKAGRIEATRFPDDRDGLRLYDTGDIVRQEADGALTMLGRADRVVKVNGHRISLAEVEAHLLAMPGCAQAATIERRGPRGSTLAAFFTRPGMAGGETEARAWLSARLPAAMVPARLVRVEAMPLLPGGKLNYRALAALLEKEPAEVVTVTATDDLSRLRALWNDVLQRPAADEDPDRDFSDLGGDSLRLLELRLAIERAFGRDIDPEAFLERPTLRRLAELAGIAGLPPQAAVAAGTIAFRLVRPAVGPSRGVALSMPGWSGAAVAGPWLAADAFAGFDIWACSVALPAANMVEGGHWLGVAQAIAAAVEAGECPPPAVLFGYSIAGYVAWLVDRLLANGGVVRPEAVICLDTVPMHRPRRLANRAVRRVLAAAAAPAPGRMLLLRRAALRPIVSPGVARLCWTAADADLSVVTVRTLEHADMESIAVLAAVRPAITAFLDRHPLPAAPVAVETVSGLLFDLIAGERPVTADLLARAIGDLPRSGTRLSLAAVQYLAVAHGDLPATRAALARLRRAGPPSPALRYATRLLDDLAAGRAIRPARVIDDPAIGSFAAVDRALAMRSADPGVRGLGVGLVRRVAAIATAGGWWRARSAGAFGRTTASRGWRALRRRR